MMLTNGLSLVASLQEVFSPLLPSGTLNTWRWTPFQSSYIEYQISYPSQPNWEAVWRLWGYRKSTECKQPNSCSFTEVWLWSNHLICASVSSLTVLTSLFGTWEGLNKTTYVKASCKYVFLETTIQFINIFALLDNTTWVLYAAVDS